MADMATPVTMTSENRSSTRTVSGIACEHCGASNSSDQRFCGACGLRLWQPCHACNTQNAIDVTYCGNCGQNLSEQFANAKAAITRQIDLGKTLCKQGKYYEAIDTLKSVSDFGDTRLKNYAAAAAQLEKKIVEIRQQKAAVVDSVYAKVQQQLETGHYQSAWTSMQQIPVGLRSNKMSQTAKTLETRINEIETLSNNVRDAIAAKSYDGLLPVVERLCELKNDDEKLTALRLKLRARENNSQIQLARSRIRLAVERLNAENYAAAAKQLADVPHDLQLDEKLQQTADQAREICWLYDDIRLQPFATPQSVALLKRFQKLRPNAEAGRHLAARFQPGSTKKIKDRRQTFTALNEPRSRIVADLPMFWWTGFANCDIRPESSETLKKYPGQFAVAYGLALQGVQLAKLPTNLFIDVGTSMLQRLSSRNRRIMGDDAWGIDIGATGLKAIHLTRVNRSTEICIEAAAVVLHSTSLNLAADSENRSAIIAESLEKLAGTFDVERGPAVISLSAPKTLGRFFSLPRLTPKKVKDAIHFEAKHQIPLPEASVVFDHHVWPSDERMQEVALIAAQRDQVLTLQNAFTESPFQVVGVQSACVALYNACHREFLWRRENSEPESTDKETDADSQEVLAVLDIGAESTVFSLISNNGIRFRNLPFGTIRLSQLVSKQFGCGRTRADILRTRIESNPWLHKIGDVLSNGFDDLLKDLGRTLSSMTTDVGQPTMLIITGGGANQHGCLRSIVGRPELSLMPE